MSQCMHWNEGDSHTQSGGSAVSSQQLEGRPVARKLCHVQGIKKKSDTRRFGLPRTLELLTLPSKEAGDLVDD
ncbi:hypothetical protein AbraIFM66950_008384, partial [Aspergillus brasiliensis]